MLKHLLVLGVVIPSTLVGYHVLAGASGNGVNAATHALQSVGDLTIGHGYELSDLKILERDMYFVETHYVERERLDPEAMFQGALDMVERQVSEVMFQREPGGSRLHVSVGSYTTTLVLQPLDDMDAMHTELGRVAAILQEHLSEETSLPDVEYAMVNGALSTLDPHTVLMPPVAAKEMEVDNAGEFGGLGIKITTLNGELTIEEPMPDTPAAKAKLQSDDKIVRIEDESTINMDLNEAVSKLRGPVGEPVTIWIMRKGFDEPKPVKIVRAVIQVNPVEAALLEGGIAYVSIQGFHKQVSKMLEDHLLHMRREAGGPLKGLVLDLRGNPGGYLTQAIEVSDKFLSEGVIVSTVEGASNKREEKQATGGNTQPRYPIVVLVNGSSASASEIVAGALRNHDRAVVIGERTFGKGSVQHLYTNNDNSNLKLTVAKYLTPGDQSIQSVGIPPDILLQKSTIEPPDPEEKEANPTVSLYWREWLNREADLDHSLGKISEDDSQPAYTVRFLAEMHEDDTDEPSGIPKSASDWEVEFAREVLLVAPGPRRADILQAVAPVVARAQRDEADRIQKAFAKLGIDWTDGRNTAEPLLRVDLDLGDDGVLKAGEEENITLRVTNLGDEPLYRLSAVMTSENVWLDHREFYFGLIAPGQTREYSQRVVLQEGYGGEITPADITFRDQEHDRLTTHTELVQTIGRELPSFSYELTLHDDGTGESRGNANGIPEPGEVIDLEIKVTNTGRGSSSEAFARVKNESGRQLDLRKGSIELGRLQDVTGKACDKKVEPGHPDGCLRRLLPGESQSERVSFELRELPEDGNWKLAVQVGDIRAYDYTSIQRGGFYDYFQLAETLELSPDHPLDGVVRAPPVIEITRAPDAEVLDPAVVISGVATDDESLRDVIVYHGDNKVFYQGGGELIRTIPFTAERTLQPGENLIVVLVRDERGLSATRAVSTWYAPPKQEANAASAVGGAG